MSQLRDRWKRWKVRKRPRLRGGEPVTFYDPTGLVPLARMRVETITSDFHEGMTITLVSEQTLMRKWETPPRSW